MKAVVRRYWQFQKNTLEYGSWTKEAFVLCFQPSTHLEFTKQIGRNCLAIYRSKISYNIKCIACSSNSKNCKGHDSDNSYASQSLVAGHPKKFNFYF